MSDIYVTSLRFNSGVLYVGTSLGDAKAAADTDMRDRDEFDNYKQLVDWDDDWYPRQKHQPANLIETLYAISYVIGRYEVTP